jgi:hypothetical protein
MQPQFSVQGWLVPEYKVGLDYPFFCRYPSKEVDTSGALTSDVILNKRQYGPQLTRVFSSRLSKAYLANTCGSGFCR